MSDRTEKIIKEKIQEELKRPIPDVWPQIERSIRNMEKNKKQTSSNRNRPVWITAIALASAAAVFAIVYFGGLAGSVKTPLPTAVVQNETTAPAKIVIPSDTPVVSENNAVRPPVPFTTDSSLTATPGIAAKIATYDTIKALINSGKDTTVIYVKFQKDLGSAANKGGDPNRLYTTYEMQVIKSFKGALKAGDTVTVKTTGGASAKVWIEDNFVEKFTDRFEYVLFLTGTAEKGKAVYSLVSPLQGYVPILDNKVSLNTKIEYNGLFTQDETLASLSHAIEEAIK